MAQSDTGTTDHLHIAERALSEAYGRSMDVQYLKSLDAIIEAREIIQQHPEHPLRTMLLEKLGVWHAGRT